MATRNVTVGRSYTLVANDGEWSAVSVVDVTVPPNSVRAAWPQFAVVASGDSPPAASIQGHTPLGPEAGLSVSLIGGGDLYARVHPLLGDADTTLLLGVS